jgi:hypothetical protein
MRQFGIAILSITMQSTAAVPLCNSAPSRPHVADSA